MELEDTNRTRLYEAKALHSLSGKLLQRCVMLINPTILCSFVLVTGRVYQTHPGKLGPPWPILTLQLLEEEMAEDNRSL